MSVPITSLAQLDPNGTYSYADYLTWEFEGLEEIVHGQLLPPPTYDEPHQRVCGQLLGALRPALAAPARRGHYRTSVALPGGGGAAYASVVVPDFWVARPGQAFDGQGGLGPPAWVVEVTAPGSAARDWRTKFDLYEENGVGEYWIADPLAHSISAFVLDPASARYRLAGEYTRPGPMPCATLPALALNWADVFPNAEGE